MAKWGGQADAAVETAGGGGGNFVPAPRGIYTIEVLETKDGTTKESKRPKVDLECEIVDEGEHFGKKVWLTITHIPKGEKGHGLMLHSLHAFGLALSGGYELDTTDLQGQTARALLGLTTREKVKDGKTYLEGLERDAPQYFDAVVNPGGGGGAGDPTEGKGSRKTELDGLLGKATLTNSEVARVIEIQGELAKIDSSSK